MCQEIEVNGQEIERPNGTCWCPLGGEGIYSVVECLATYADFGRAIYKILCKDQDPAEREWSVKVTIKRW